MNLRKLFITIICFSLISSNILIVDAAIEGPDGNGLTTAGLYLACISACALAGWVTGGGAAPGCIAACAAIGFASPTDNPPPPST